MIDAGQLDAVRFERLAAAARADLAVGRAETAAAGLGRALDLWRGPALADVADLDLARADAARLEEARLSALEDRIEADLICGRHTGVIAELDGLIASNPLRERLCGQQILALYAAAVAVREEPGRPLLDSITSRFAGTEAMLIMDSCEHVLEAVAEVVVAVASRCPGVQVLATSQTRLRVPGEASWPVPPMTVPAPDERDPESVRRAESVRLFCDRAALARPGFSLTAANATAVAEICRRLDSIPLAIELAAARVNALTAGQLSARLGDRFRLLTGGSRTGLARHRTLRAALEWSHGLLTATEQVCFRRLAIFAGGCTIEAAEAVCPDQKLPRQAVFETVTSLVERSLLTTQERSGSMRYGMLESIRQYAGLRLDEAGERPALSRRQLGWLLEFAGQADLDGFDQGAWLDLLEADHDNFVAGLEWSLSAPAPDPGAGPDPLARSALALAGALAPFWRVRGYTGLGRRWLDSALALTMPGSEADLRLRAAGLDGAGQLASVQGNQDAQRVYQHESLAIWRRLGDDARIASCLVDLGSAAHTVGEYPAAQAMYAEALDLARDCDDSPRMGKSLSGLGALALHQDDLERATAHFTDAKACFRAVGDLRRDFTAAVSFHRRSLALAEAIGEPRSIAESLEGLAEAESAMGAMERAARLLGAAGGLRDAIGAPIPGPDLGRYHDARVAAELALGGELFAAEMAAGRALSVADAVRFANSDDLSAGRRPAPG